MKKICATCGHIFTKKYGLSSAQWAARKYCGLKCIKLDRRLGITCIGCEEQFTVPRHQVKRKFCSKKCKELNQVLVALKGKNAPNWQGGKTAEANLIRHSKAYRDWRKAVFERDDYTCQSCEVRGGTLNADHIKPFA